jgi:hypothetical protein
MPTATYTYLPSATTESNAREGQIDGASHRALTPIAYTIDEAALISSCSRDVLYRAAGGGLLKIRKLGTRTIVLADDLREFLAALPVGLAADQRNRAARARRGPGLGCLSGS